ncbi:MAG: lysostaphin resistance A-like protein [Solirubrobacterales bacterium]
MNQRAPAAAPPTPTAPESASRSLPEIPWSPKDTGWGLVAGLILAVLIAPALVLPFDPELDSIGALLAAQALLGTSLLFVSIGIASEWRFRPLGVALRRLGLRNLRFSGLGIGLLTWFAYLIAVLVFVSLPITPEPQQEDIGSELGIGGESALVAVLAVLLIVGLASISEELFFRGFLFAGLRSRWPFWAAGLLAGAIFGLIHAPTGITTVIPLGALGLALCWLYERTGSLWPCMLVHAINNGLALAVVA